MEETTVKAHPGTRKQVMVERARSAEWWDEVMALAGSISR